MFNDNYKIIVMMGILMFCPAWILDWNWNVIIMQKRFPSYFRHITLSFFSSHKHSWGLKIRVRERKTKCVVGGSRLGDDRKEKERSIYRERRSVERSQVNKLVCKLYLRHCKTASYYLTSFLFSISIVMLYTTYISS